MAVPVDPAVTARARMERARPVPASCEGTSVSSRFAPSGRCSGRISNLLIYQMLDTTCDAGMIRTQRTRHLSQYIVLLLA